MISLDEYIIFLFKYCKYIVIIERSAGRVCHIIVLNILKVRPHVVISSLPLIAPGLQIVVQSPAARRTLALLLQQFGNFQK